MFTTHYLEEAERWVDRSIILHQGKVRADGSVTEIKAQERESASVFIAALVSSRFCGFLVCSRPKKSGSSIEKAEVKQSEIARLETGNAVPKSGFPAGGL